MDILCRPVRQSVRSGSRGFFTTMVFFLIDSFFLIGSSCMCCYTGKHVRLQEGPASRPANHWQPARQPAGRQQAIQPARETDGQAAASQSGPCQGKLFRNFSGDPCAILAATTPPKNPNRGPHRKVRIAKSKKTLWISIDFPLWTLSGESFSKFCRRPLRRLCRHHAPKKN